MITNCQPSIGKPQKGVWGVFPPNAPSAHTGIFAQYASDWEIAQNHITMWKNEHNKYGINLNYCLFNNTSCNYIDGSGTTGTAIEFGFLDQSAITTFMGDGYTIGCNIVDGTENGIHVIGNMGVQSNFTIKGNDFKFHTNGLHYGKNTITTPQDWLGNRWNEIPVLANGWQAYNENTNYIQNSVQSTSPILLPSTQYQEPFNWFIFFNNPTGKGDFDCNDVAVDKYCDKFPENCDNCVTALDDDIAQNTITNSPYTPQTVWMMDKSLYQKVDNNPSLRADTMMDNYYTNMQGSFIAEITAIEKAVRSALAIDTNVVIGLKLLKINSTVNYDSLYNLLPVYAKAIDSGYSTIGIKILINSLLYALKNNTAIIDSVSTIKEDERNQSVDDAAADVVVLSAAVSIEDNERDVHTIYLNTIAKGIFTFTNAEINTLFNIANQCPLLGGEAVFRARAMLYLYNPNLNYDNRSLCNQVGIEYRKGKDEKITENDFVIYPNPTLDNITIEHKMPTGCNVVFALNNALGQTIKKIVLPIDKQKYVIVTNDIAPGVYQYHLSCNELVLYHGKLIKLK